MTYAQIPAADIVEGDKIEIGTQTQQVIRIRLCGDCRVEILHADPIPNDSGCCQPRYCFTTETHKFWVLRK